MGTIIIALPNIKNSEKVNEVLKNHGFSQNVICAYGREVLRKVSTQDYGVVICTNSLKDMSYLELAEYLPEYFTILLLSSDITESAITEGIMRLKNPFRPADLVNTVDLILSTLERKIKKNKKRPVRTPEENRIIEKAKYLLMDRNDMTEPEAFRYIQKTSMDTGRTLVETAEMVLMLDWDR